MSNSNLNNSLNADYEENLKAFLNERTEYLKEVNQFPVVEIWYCRIQYVYTDGSYSKGVLNYFKTQPEETVLSFLNNDPLYLNYNKKNKHLDYFTVTKPVYITELIILEKLKFLGNSNEKPDEKRASSIYEDKHGILNKIKKNKPKNNNNNNLTLFENETD